MNRYDKYKSVSLPWVNEIPEHWEIIRNKNIFMEKKKSVGSQFEKYKLLSLSLKGVIERNLEDGGKFPASFEKYTIVNPKDLVFCLFDIDETPRTIGISKIEGMITSAYNIMAVKKDCAKYMYYFYLYLDFIKGLKPYYSSLRKTVNIDTFNSFKILIPPIKEQEQIVNYLDWKINGIDRLIQLEKEKIKALEKLKEINFNKIIDSSQKNKSIKIKFFANLYGRIGWQGLNSSEYGDEGVYLITGTDFYNGTIDFSKCVRVPNFRWEQNDKIQIKNGDLLITKDGTVGKLAIVTNLVENATLNSGIMKIDFFRNDIVTKEYLFYILKSNIFKSWFIDLNAGFATIIHLYQKDFYNFSFKYPEMREQQIIVSKIKTLESVFNNQIAKIEESIKALGLLKQSLISEVVTGKIDVRNVVIPEYEKVTLLDDEIEEFDEMKGIEDGN